MKTKEDFKITNMKIVERGETWSLQTTVENTKGQKCVFLIWETDVENWRLGFFGSVILNFEGKGATMDCKKLYEAHKQFFPEYYI